MTDILALDCATDSCSVAMRLDGSITSRCELIPRQHNQGVFSMLDEVLGGRSPADAGLQYLAYNQGPGSFTGLRIAASAIQGLAYACELPVVGVSTLACLAQGVWRQGLADPSATLLVMLDARINEVYWGLYGWQEGVAVSLLPDAVSQPEEIPAELPTGSGGLVAVGSGLRYREQLAAALCASLAGELPEQWPDSVDTLTLAELEIAQGRLLSPEQVQPVYLRNEINWKKISEQG
jgi:tRNA threonylcarbamoyladenosine biosynthesis protein TsaB